MRLVRGLLVLVALAGIFVAAPRRARGADDAEKDPAVRDAGMRRRVDELLSAAWKDASVAPATRAGDAEFMRRIYLDLTGRIPRVSQARAFLTDRSPEKRARLADELLLSPSHPTHLADVWSQFLLPDTATVEGAGGTAAFESWLRNRFAANGSYAETVRELLLATGGPGELGPVLFYTALELKPEKIAASTSRAFLGVQIQCAECHNHPFAKWTQRDFWGYAAFFARVSGQSDVPMAVRVQDRTVGEVMLPNSKDVVPPRYLLGAIVADDGKATRRERLAEWMTSRSNPYFARAAVNRVWAQLFGRGLVDPLDDLRDDQPPRLAKVLDELSTYFVSTNYDVRRLLRVLATTDAYQLASEESASQERPHDLFAAMQIKVLSAEQLYNCVSIATCRPNDNILASVPSSSARRAMLNRTAFVNSFRAPSGASTEYLAGIPQALMLLNGRLVDDASDIERSDILVSMQAPFMSDDDRVDTLFLSTLSRPPSDEMRRKFSQYIASQPSASAKRHALGNILWALLNSAEFAVNH